jgi:microcystin-dependent protein
MWSGPEIPSNWVLCDGFTYNIPGGTIQTPDLRGRFILSSGSGAGLTPRSINQTGGQEQVTLSQAQMPSHIHDVSAYTTGDGQHTHGIYDPGHNHVITTQSGSIFENNAPGYRQIAAGNGISGGSWQSDNNFTGISITSDYSAHNHTINVNQSVKGSDNSHENMPPFYVLAFIMRIL